MPYGANISQLPLRPIEVGLERRKRSLMRSPDRKPGLCDIHRYTSRIKEFKLSDAIVLSYFRNLRFLSAVCLITGVAAFWVLSPELLLAKPATLCSPDVGLIAKVIKETFLTHVCSTHQVSSPCSYCNEPLNQVAREWFSPSENLTFDPLGISAEEVARAQSKKAFAISLAIILLGIALSESVSQYGWMSG